MDEPPVCGGSQRHEKGLLLAAHQWVDGIALFEQRLCRFARKQGFRVKEEDPILYFTQFYFDSFKLV